MRSRRVPGKQAYEWGIATECVADDKLETATDRLADELRALLREAGEVAMQEARRLESELEQISEAIARAMEQPDDPAAYRRRWKAKDWISLWSPE